MDFSDLYYGLRRDEVLRRRRLGLEGRRQERAQLRAAAAACNEALARYYESSLTFSDPAISYIASN